MDNVTKTLTTKYNELRILLKLILLIFFLGYLSFIPTGPYPIFLWNGLKLDHLFLLATLTFSVLLFPFKWSREITPILGSVLLFLGIAFTSTLVSVNLSVSLKGFIAALFYALIALFTSLLVFNYVSFIRKFLFVMAAFAALLILFQYFFFDFGSIGRMALSSIPRWHPEFEQLGGTYVDPNMTAIGLLLCVIIYMPEYLKRRGTFYSILMLPVSFFAPFFIIIVACFILLSRTALFSFAVAIIWGSLYSIITKKRNSWKQIIKKINVIVLFSCLSLFFLFLVEPKRVTSLINRVTRFSKDNLTESETQRIFYSQQALDTWLNDPKTFTVGNGFFTSNPHNEILRSLSGSGLFGLLSFLGMFLVFYFKCCHVRPSSGNYSFSQNALFAYIFIAIQFYGHTKTMWVALTFLLINYLAEMVSQQKIQINRRVYNDSWNQEHFAT